MKKRRINLLIFMLAFMLTFSSVLSVFTSNAQASIIAANEDMYPNKTSTVQKESDKEDGPEEEKAEEVQPEEEQPEEEEPEEQPEEEPKEEPEEEPEEELSEEELRQIKLKQITGALKELFTGIFGINSDYSDLDSRMVDFLEKARAGVYSEEQLLAFKNGASILIAGVLGADISGLDSLSFLKLGLDASSSVHYINSPKDLQKVYDNGAIWFGADWWSDTIILNKDIDMAGVKMSAIGDKKKAFRGTFEGNGHTIYNLGNGNGSTDGMGLFGYTKNATIRNLTLANAYFSAKKNVGAIVGIMDGGTIMNCSVVNSRVSTPLIGNYIGNNANDNVGGLVGYANGGYITSCRSRNNTIYLSQGEGAGGIVGEASNVKISYCSTSGNTIESSAYMYSEVTSDNGVSFTQSAHLGGTAAGGIAGKSRDSEIAYCNAYNYVEAGLHHAGGLIGSSYADTIAFCTAGDTVAMGGASASSVVAGSITGSHAGGLVGYLSSSRVENCYSTATVKSLSEYSQSFMGGLIGQAVLDQRQNKFDVVTVEHCYSTGEVNKGKNSKGNQYGDGPKYIGGLIGLAQSGKVVVTSSYYDKQKSGMNNSDGGIPKSSAELTNISTFKGWDISGEANTARRWAIKEGVSPPTLSQLPVD